MGTWDVELFDDDLASDIRGQFEELTEEGFSCEEATRILLEEYADDLEDEDAEPVVWLALAAVQWEWGCLQDEVKAIAMEIIDGGTGLKHWAEDPELLSERQTVLERLKEQLNSPPPKKCRNK